jgi:hypothetical protein
VTATAVARLAERESAAGNRTSARLAYLRACTYHRTAGVMLLGAPLDDRLVSACTGAHRGIAGSTANPRSQRDRSGDFSGSSGAFREPRQD